MLDLTWPCGVGGLPRVPGASLHAAGGLPGGSESSPSEPCARFPQLSPWSPGAEASDSCQPHLAEERTGRYRGSKENRLASELSSVAGSQGCHHPRLRECSQCSPSGSLFPSLSQHGPHPRQVQLRPIPSPLVPVFSWALVPTSLTFLFSSQVHGQHLCPVWPGEWQSGGWAPGCGHRIWAGVVAAVSPVCCRNRVSGGGDTPSPSPTCAWESRRGCGAVGPSLSPQPSFTADFNPLPRWCGGSARGPGSLST